MSATIKCPWCHALLKLPEAGLGDRLVCPKCAKEVTHLPNPPTPEKKPLPPLHPPEVEEQPLPKLEGVARKPPTVMGCVGLMLAGPAPFLLASGCIVLDHSLKWFDPNSGLAAGVCCLMVGVAGVWMFPTGWFSKVVMTVIYLPAMLFLLLLYALYFVGVVYNEWL